jgi:hypothetical protein
MGKKVTWRDNLVERPPVNEHGVSIQVQVFTDRGRVLGGYWDSNRGMWFIQGELPPEKVVQWTNLLETIE